MKESVVFVGDHLGGRLRGYRWIVFLVTCFLFGPGARAADVITYTVGKIHHYFQFDTGAPIEDSINPWEGGAAVYPTVLSPNSVLTAAYWSSGGSTNFMGLRYNRYERQSYYATPAALDAAFPNGPYTIQIDTRNQGTFLCNLPLTGNVYPNAPRFTNYAAAQSIDATQPFTLAWDAFAGGTTNDYALLLISSAPNETPTNYFASPLPGQVGAVTGTNRALLIPAKTLPPGKQLFAKLSFLKVTETNLTSYPGVIGYAGYGTVTVMPLQTLPRVGLPQIVECPLARTSAVGSKVIFSVAATGGSLTYQWKKNGVDLPGQTNNLLILSPATPADQASYSVGVTNSFGGMLSCTANLYVVDRTAGQRDPQLNPTICPNNSVNVIRQQRDGKLVLGGTFTSIGSGANQASGVTRYRADGSWDTGFRVGTMSGAQISALEIQPDDRIVIGGTFSDYGGIPRLGLARLLPDGGLDLTFNTGTGVNGWVYAIALQNDGKVLIGGQFTQVNGTTRSNIARLNTNGTVDFSFNPGNAANARVTTLTIQPDGKILAGGWFTNFNGFARSRLVRLESTGAVDTNFNIGTGFNDWVTSIAVQPDTRILVGGNFNTNNGVVQRKLVRLLNNGAMDVPFSFNMTNGLRKAGSPDLGYVNSIALQPDGKIVVCGWFDFYNGVFRGNLARLLPDGLLDTNFTAGIGSEPYCVIAPGDGSIALAGNFSSFSSCYFGKLLTDSGIGSPGITIQPASQTNLFGSVTTFSVTAGGGGLTYQWMKGGVPIPNATNSTYTIPYTVDTDAGNYQVLVQNTAGSVLSDIAALTVIVTPDFDWARRFGATSGGSGRGIVADPYGNTMVAGYYVGSLSVGTNTLNSSGGQEIFLARFDSAGNPVWARTAGSALSESGWAVAQDAAGNTILAGYIRTNATFGAITVTNAGSFDPFVAKYDPTGNLLWVRTATGTSDERGYGVTTDGTGNIYTCGFYNGPLNFGGTIITGSGTYLAKYDPNGAIVWVRAIPATACCNAGRALAFDPAGYVYMAGILGGIATFAATTLTTYGGNDFFIAKYDLNGNLVWVRQGGGVTSEDAYGVAVGPDGTVTATGYFSGTANFSGTNILAPGTNVAMFLANYDPAGQLRWVQAAGGNADVAGYGVSVDRSGVVWVTGEFAGTADFSGMSRTALGAYGQADIFVARYNSEGNVLSAYVAGGINYDFGFALATDAGGTAYVTGSYAGVASFGGSSLTNAAGLGDVFLTRLGAGIARPALVSSPSSPGNLVLSWGVGAADWLLTYTPTIGVPPSVVNLARATNNGIISVTIPTTGTAGFYQLRAP